MVFRAVKILFQQGIDHNIGLKKVNNIKGRTKLTKWEGTSFLVILKSN